MGKIEKGMILPDDEYNRALIQNVHPPHWDNPVPDGRYNLVVIGAGTAGLVTAAIASGLGAKVALIERHLMGGDCLNVGCVPSKGLIRASRVWESVQNSGNFGIGATDALKFDFGAAMARMRRLRTQISSNDSAQRYRNMGVDVFMGEGRFLGPDSIEVDGKILRFSRAAICTGARAAVPLILGLKEAGFLTNESLFTLTNLPRRLAVIGAGPIGCEMAQAFARFGSKVTLFERTGQVLLREDAEAAAIIQEQMEKDGVEFIFGSSVTRIETRGAEKILFYEVKGERKEAVIDEILIGLGRAPNLEGLDLERAGVKYEAQYGVIVNERLQTTNARIYAAGDICSRYKFTHTADAAAQILIQNALFPHPFGLGYATTESLIIPWCTYTDPEIAHVGLYETDAQAKWMDVDTFTCRLNDVDRAILDGEDKGFVRVHVKKGTDQILGATIVAAHAGELISQLTVAMKGGIGLSTISNTIFPYPTQAEVIKRVANVWRRRKFTEKKKSILEKWFAWTR